MNAHTAEQEATILKTSLSAIATPAVSMTARTIDEFIQKQFAAAKSEGFSGIKSMGSRAANLGFKSSANSRYAEFLEAFQATPALTAKYAERYPNCYFLPWRAFHLTLKALDLWCELPEFYAGAVPENQIMMMEMFAEEGVREDDKFHCSELRSLQPKILNNVDLVFREALGDSSWEELPQVNYQMRELIYERSRRLKQNPDSIGFSRDNPRFDEAIRGMTLRAMYEEARNSFFVCAPEVAFTSTTDWLERFKNLADAVDQPTQAPNDPLVIRFVKGGALVVAAWGDEAAFINEAVRELGI